MRLQKFYYWLIVGLSATTSLACGQAPEMANRWQIRENGAISWSIDHRVPHEDHIEMSGEKISAIIRYGVQVDSSFTIHRSLVWPMLRSHPNKTRNHLNRIFTWDIIREIHVNEKLMTAEKVKQISLDGTLTVVSTWKPGIEITRTMFPSRTLPAYIETYQLKNLSAKPVMVEIPEYANTYVTDSAKGIYGSYKYIAQSTGGGSFQLEPGKQIMFHAQFYAVKKSETLAGLKPDVERESRQKLIQQWWSDLVLETPDEIVNRSFAFAKIRAAESIYRTKGGLMHGPGGGAYYAAIWANDQAEYVGPFFPYLGYATGNEASLNAYKHFARYMNPEFKAIPSSIIAEGEGTWHGAKDRGDAAMIAYGASRFALSLGDKKIAGELWPSSNGPWNFVIKRSTKTELWRPTQTSLKTGSRPATQTFVLPRYIMTLCCRPHTWAKNLANQPRS